MRVFRAEIRLIQISVAVSVVIIAFGLFFFRAETKEQGSAESQAEQNVTADADQTPKIVCLGDSYTFGYPYKQDASWPQHLATALGMQVANEGKMQQTSADLLARFDEDVVLKYQPHTVVILSGAGDALNSPPIPLETYQANIKGLVQKARENGIKPILVLPFSSKGSLGSAGSAGDADADAAYSAVIVQYRAWLTTYAASDSVDIVDVQSMLCDGDNGIKKQYTDNEKYPNEEGYREMGIFIAEKIKGKIG